MEENDIVLINTPITCSRLSDGIKEITEKPPTLLKSRFTAAPKPPDILYKNQTVYVINTCFYIGKSEVIAYEHYEHNLSYRIEPPIKAACMMFGSVPVFATTKEYLDTFLELTEKFNIVSSDNSPIFFLPGRFPRLNTGQNVNAICYEKNNCLTTMDAYGFENTISLESNMRWGLDDFFKPISDFLNLLIKGIRKDLAACKMKLEILEQKRQEDIFNYLSDFNVAESDRVLHNLLLAREEQVYLDNQVSVIKLKKEVAEKVEIINKSKRILPSGRKGVALRNAYLQAPALSRFLDFYKIERVGRYLNSEFIFRKQLTVEGIDYGRPIVRIVMALPPIAVRGKFIMENSGVTVESADYNIFTHPHIETDQRWCLGTFIGPIESAILGGNIPLAASLIWQYLSTYNSESPLINLEHCRNIMRLATRRNFLISRK